MDDISDIKLTTQTNKILNLKNNNQNITYSKKNEKSTQKQKENYSIENSHPFGGNNNLMSSSAPLSDIQMNSGITAQGPFHGPSSSVGRIFNLLPQVREEEREGERENERERERE